MVWTAEEEEEEEEEEVGRAEEGALRARGDGGYGVFDALVDVCEDAFVEEVVDEEDVAVAMRAPTAHAAACNRNACSRVCLVNMAMTLSRTMSSGARRSHKALQQQRRPDATSKV